MIDEGELLRWLLYFSHELLSSGQSSRTNYECGRTTGTPLTSVQWNTETTLYNYCFNAIL